MANTDKKTSALVVTEQPGVLAVLDLDVSMLQGDAGSGSQNITRDDVSTPIISILQANSPQCKKSDSRYIKGAEEGMFYNNVTQEVYAAQPGLVVIPCYFEKVFIEWRPNRGGFVAIHAANTPLRNVVELKEVTEGSNTKTMPTLPNGNHLIETNQYYVLIVREDGTLDPAVISMTSSAISASRKWNALIKGVILQGPNGPFNPASYYNTYKLTTAARQSDTHSWFTWVVSNNGPVPNMDIYRAAKGFEKAISSGAVVVKQEQDEAVTAVVVDEEVAY